MNTRNNLLCTLLMPISVMIILVSPALNAKPSQKKFKTKVSEDVYLEYVGMAEKKVPSGEGTIRVKKKNLDVSSSNIGGLNIPIVSSSYSYSDEITGDFCGSSVENATMTLPEGIIFRGTVEYQASYTGIVYTVSNGSFEVSINGAKGPELIPVSGPFSITRTWADERLSFEPLRYKKQEKGYVVRAAYEKKTRKLFSAYDSFVGTSPTITKEWTAVWQPYKFENLNPHLENELKDQDIDDFFLDYGDKGKGIYANKEGRLTIVRADGDSLSVIEPYDKYGYNFDAKQFSLFRHLEGGEMSVHLTDGKNFEIGDINHYENPDAGSTNEKKKIMPLVETFVQDMPESCKTCIGLNKQLGVADRENKESQKRTTRRTESSMAVELAYDNGDTYIGTIYLPDAYYEETRNKELLFMTAVPESGVDLYTGLYTKASGEKKYYLYGYPASEFAQLVVARIEEIEEAQKAEEIRKQDAEKKTIEEAEAREKEFKKLRAEQTRKYGKKYVDAIYDAHEIIVGTPEGLLKEYYTEKAYEEKDFVYYLFTSVEHRIACGVAVNKSTHRVDSVIVDWEK